MLFRRRKKTKQRAYHDVDVVTLGGGVGHLDETDMRTLAGKVARTHGEYLAPSFDRPRFFIVSGVVLLLASVLFVRTVYLSVASHDRYAELALKNRRRVEIIVPPRAQITDRNGVNLTENIPSFVLSIIPADVPTRFEERQQFIEQLSSLIGVSQREIEETLDQFAGNAQPVPILDSLRYDQAMKLMVETEELKGVRLMSRTVRTYPHSNEISSLSHILGYTGVISKPEYETFSAKGYLPKDRVGRTGIEASYESVLRGTTGRREFEVDALGQFRETVAQVPAEMSPLMELSIDLNLQRAAERALKNGMTRIGRRRGAVVAMDPRNGEIKALVSLPAYSNNLFAERLRQEDYDRLNNNKDHPLFPRAISGEYPSGSTIKPMIAVAALAEKIVTPKTTVISRGGIAIGNFFFPDWKAGGHGATNLSKAITESVNTYFYTISGGYGAQEGLGPDRIKKYAERFGMSVKTGIDLPSEATGLIPTASWKMDAKKEPWYIGDTYHLAIGQGDVLVTPLQIATMTATVAMEGRRPTPHLLRAFRGKDNQPQPTWPTYNAASSESVLPVKQAMRDVVTGGSGRALADLPAAIAGKTGTAESGIRRTTHSWFTSFGPFEHPELVVTVLIEEGGEGHLAAAPVAKEIWRAYLSTQKR